MQRERLTIPQWIVTILVLALSGAAGFWLAWWRGQPTMTPDSSMPVYHYPTVFVDQLRGDPDAGAKIYREYCASCHAPQPVIAVNAPTVGNVALWRLRQQRGAKVLLKNTLNGVGAMPARGGCFECSDEQLLATVNYMLQQNKNVSGGK